MSPQTISVTFTLNGKQITSPPGVPDTGNLQGNTRTMDGALTKEPIEPGLIACDVVAFCRTCN